MAPLPPELEYVWSELHLDRVSDLTFGRRMTPPSRDIHGGGLNHQRCQRGVQPRHLDHVVPGRSLRLDRCHGADRPGQPRRGRYFGLDVPVGNDSADFTSLKTPCTAARPPPTAMEASTGTDWNVAVADGAQTSLVLSNVYDSAYGGASRPLLVGLARLQRRDHRARHPSRRQRRADQLLEVYNGRRQ